MPRNRKKRSTPKKRTNSKLLAMYRTVVVVALVVGIGALFVALVSPLIADSRQVLGTEDAFIAQAKKLENKDKEKRDSSFIESKVEKRVDLSELPQIEAVTKEKKASVNITKGGVLTEIERKEDKSGFRIRANQEGEKEELEDDTLDAVKERLNKSDIQIETKEGNIVVAKRHVGARTDYPLSLDLSTNTLIVMTPSGEKKVTVLPDRVVDSLRERGILNKVGDGVARNADLSEENDAADDVVFETSSIVEPEEKEIEGEEDIELEVENGELIYKVDGTQNQKVLGFIPVNIKKTVTVSAESGEIKKEDAPLLDRLLDFIAF